MSSSPVGDIQKWLSNIFMQSSQNVCPQGRTIGRLANTSKQSEQFSVVESIVTSSLSCSGSTDFWNASNPPSAQNSVKDFAPIIASLSGKLGALCSSEVSLRQDLIGSRNLQMISTCLSVFMFAALRFILRYVTGSPHHPVDSLTTAIGETKILQDSKSYLNFSHPYTEAAVDVGKGEKIFASQMRQLRAEK